MKTLQKDILDKSIGSDNDFIIGKLNNGLTYYLKKNEKPINEIYLGLVIKVGSCVEKEKQKGIAHFVEHVCLKSNEYCNNNMLLYGYTDFQQTCYVIRCFLKSPKDIEECLDKLKDIAQGSKFCEEVIDYERNIIKEEYKRVNKRLDSKLRNKILPEILKNSRYCDRMPFGDITNIGRITKEDLVDFYEEWYMPEIMGLIVVGDFDIWKIEESIKGKFSCLKNDKKVNMPKYLIPNYGKIKSICNAYDEVIQPEINCYFKQNESSIKTYDDFKNSLIENIFCNLIVNRIKVTTGSNVFYYKEQFIKECSFIVYNIKFKEEIMERQVEKILTQFVLLMQGFNEEELMYVKKALLKDIESSYSKKNKLKSKVYFDEYIRNFILEEPIISFNYELLLIKKYIDIITMKDIEGYGVKFYNENLILEFILPLKLQYIYDKILRLIKDKNL